MARLGQRHRGARRTAPPKQGRDRHQGDVLSVLARTAREIEAAALRGRVTPAVRTKFQALAMLLRDERARAQAAPGNGSHQAEQLKRLDGIAAILAATAVRDAGLLALLGEDTSVSDAARTLKQEMMRDLGIEPTAEEIGSAETATAPAQHGVASRAAVGHLPAAGEPFPRPRLLGRSSARLPSTAPGQLGTARPAAEFLRAPPAGEPQRA